MDKLPNEIIFHIMTLLSNRDYCTCLETSPLFYRAAKYTGLNGEETMHEFERKIKKINEKNIMTVKDLKKYLELFDDDIPVAINYVYHDHFCKPFLEPKQIKNCEDNVIIKIDGDHHFYMKGSEYDKYEHYHKNFLEKIKMEFVKRGPILNL